MRAWAPLLGALALVAAGAAGYASLVGARAELTAEQRRLERLQDSLRAAAARVDTVYRTRVDTFLVRRVRVDTLTQTVEHWKHDTTEVVRYVALADSTIRACSAALQSCDEREALRIQQLDAWERRWASREKPRHPVYVWGERGLIFWLGTRAR